LFPYFGFILGLRVVQRFTDIRFELVFEFPRDEDPFLEFFLGKIHLAPIARVDKRVHPRRRDLDDQVVFLLEHHRHEVALAARARRFHHRRLLNARFFRHFVGNFVISHLYPPAGSSHAFSIAINPAQASR